MRSTYSVKPVDYSMGYIHRTPDNDIRVQNPRTSYRCGFIFGMDDQVKNIILYKNLQKKIICYYKMIYC